MFLVYFFAVLFYNVLACLVTYMLDSVWHAILDNFRPATVWGTDMLIFYCITAAFGEAWNQPWSLVQLFGMGVLLYGTAIYNAPNAGSIKLTGGWSSCFIDCSDEYEERLPVLLLAAPDTPLLSGARVGDVMVSANPSPYYGTMSPFVSGNQRRMMISPGQRGAAIVGSGAPGGTPVGVRRRGGQQREDYVVMVGGPGSGLPSGVSQYSSGGAVGGTSYGGSSGSGASTHVFNSQTLGRGMSFNTGKPSNSSGGIVLGATNYGTPPNSTQKR